MKNSTPDDKEALAKIARNKNVVRAQLRRLSLPDLEKLIEVAKEVQVEKHVLAEEMAEEERKRIERVEELRKMMEEHGITPDELAGEKKPKRGRPRKGAGEKSARAKKKGS